MTPEWPTKWKKKESKIEMNNLDLGSGLKTLIWLSISTSYDLRVAESLCCDVLKQQSVMWSLAKWAEGDEKEEETSRWGELKLRSDISNLPLKLTK